MYYLIAEGLLGRRHALDFRLMKGQRVAILDGSYSLFGPQEMGVGKGKGTNGDGLGLRPIPRFREIVQEAVAEVLLSGSASSHADGVVRGKIVPVDVGIVCNTDAVRAVARALHGRVAKELEGGT